MYIMSLGFVSLTDFESIVTEEEMFSGADPEANILFFLPCVQKMPENEAEADKMAECLLAEYNTMEKRKQIIDPLVGQRFYIVKNENNIQSDTQPAGPQFAN